MKYIFPTFDEIDTGNNVYILHDYKGLDENGEPKYCDKLDMEVVIAHNNYNELINHIYITRDRKWNKTGFRFVLAGNEYAYHFEYSEEGWNACITKIKFILEYYRKIINMILEVKLCGVVEKE